MRTLDKEKIRHHFLHSALWTEELDGDYDIEDFLPSALEKADKIINEFLILANREDLDPYVDYFGKESESQLGHDIWLSINGHGAGFFDHKLDGHEDNLQDVCRHMRDTRVAYINCVWVTELGHISIE